MSTNNEMIFVRFKLKTQNKEHKMWFTKQQYENLKELESIEYCEIINYKKNSPPQLNIAVAQERYTKTII